MGKIQKIGDVYYIEFYARGLLYSQIAGPDLAKAEKLLADTEATIAKGEALTIVREIDLPDFFQRFLKEYGAEHPPKTVHRFHTLIRHLNQFLKSQHPHVLKLTQLTPVVAESYKAHLMRSFGTTHNDKINFSILLLREILEFGIKIGFINDNPSLHIRLLKMKPKNIAITARHEAAKDLFIKDVPLAKIAQLLKLNDVAKVMYFTDLIPLTRDDIYA